jgi:hypothetical protein
MTREQTLVRLQLCTVLVHAFPQQRIDLWLQVSWQERRTYGWRVVACRCMTLRLLLAFLCDSLSPTHITSSGAESALERTQTLCITLLTPPPPLCSSPYRRVWQVHLRW